MGLTLLLFAIDKYGNKALLNAGQEKMFKVALLMMKLSTHHIDKEYIRFLMSLISVTHLQFYQQHYTTGLDFPTASIRH